MKKNIIACFIICCSITANAQQKQGDPALTEIWHPVPKVITPGNTVIADAPSDAVILFGTVKDSANWLNKEGKPFNWTAKDNSLTVVPFAGDLKTKQSFGDCQLHIEWRTPAEVKGDGQVTAVVAEAALNLLDVDPQGFDMMDRKLLLAIMEKFDGGPVGVESLAAMLGEERGTIEDVIEPYLIQQGFLMRTARGRMATRTAYIHFGLKAPERTVTPDLFSEGSA